jgi:hypothetical protein
MIIYTKAYTERDLKGILNLQKANLAKNLSPEEISREGFVTVDHSYRQLKILNAVERHVIAKNGDAVIGYLLAMTKYASDKIPILVPMFHEFDRISFHGRLIQSYDYLVVGQVCVDKAFRGQGVFDACYTIYKEFYGTRYDFVITEIAVSNPRSLKAHSRIGFQTIASYNDGNTKWNIVLWDWKAQAG